MARFFSQGVIIAFCAVCVRPAWPQAVVARSAVEKSTAGERVVISVGDEKITAAEFEKFIQALPPQYRAFYGGAGKHLLPQYFVRMKILSAEAIKEKLVDQPDVARAIETARESILADAARRHIEQSIPVTDQELRELYQKDKGLSEEIRLRHILVPTENAPLKSDDGGRPALPEPEARKKLEDIRQRILAGADFASMAKQYSGDAATAASGGDMGVLQRDKVVPAVVHAADMLQPSQVSDILITPYGLEIVQVAAKRIKSFEEVKPALETELRLSKTEEVIKRLMDNYHIVIDQEYFAGPATKQNSPSSSPTP
jgi:parvulin-like peptidyl-prolyl isomerase